MNMSSSRPSSNGHPNFSPNSNMNDNYNQRRSWNNDNPLAASSPGRFGGPFIPAMVQQRHMYQNQFNPRKSSPMNYNNKPNFMSPPSPFHTPRSSNNSSFQGSFNSPRRTYSPRHSNHHNNSPYGRNNRNSMGRKSFQGNQKPPANRYFKQSMMEDPWQNCKGSKVQTNSSFKSTHGGSVKKGRYFS